MRVQCLLWDFGDTLCDELSLWRSSPEWMEVYHSFDEPGGIGAAWSIGDLDTHEVAAKLAEHMTLSKAEIHAHLCRTDLFEFFPFTYAFLSARHLPQAIVTVNPTQFLAMAQNLGFDQIADAIVVSGEERTIDKGVLSEIALRRIPIDCPNDRAFLIDNKQSNIDAWTRRGGIGYRYTTDSAFQRDVAGGIDHLIGRRGQLDRA
jgi:phosphoglycolate phosphatase-like HAD superfamily hydrolase